MIDKLIIYKQNVIIISYRIWIYYIYNFRSILLQNLNLMSPTEKVVKMIVTRRWLLQEGEISYDLYNNDQDELYKNIPLLFNGMIKNDNEN